MNLSFTESSRKLGNYLCNPCTRRDIRKMSPTHFPHQTPLRSWRHFKLLAYSLRMTLTRRHQQTPYFWKIVEACSKLNYLGLPDLKKCNLEHNRVEYFRLQFKKLQQILDLRRLKQLENFDIPICCWSPTTSFSDAMLVTLYDLCAKHTMLFSNVDPGFLSKIGSPFRKQLAPHVASLFEGQSKLGVNFDEVILPQVFKISQLLWNSSSRHIRRSLNRVLLPGLRKFEIQLPWENQTLLNASLEYVRTEFPCLQETSINRHPQTGPGAAGHGNDNAIFCGSGLDTPAFVGVTSKKY